MATINDEARSELLQAMNVLMERRSGTSDAEERAVITDALKRMDVEFNRLEQAELLIAADAIANASDALEWAIGAAKLRPFDNLLNAVEVSLSRLEQIGSRLPSRESLARADCPDEPFAAPIGVPSDLSKSTVFADLADEYCASYDACQVQAGRQANVNFYVSCLLKFKPTYQNVVAELNGIPWQFVGITHGMEAGFDFSRHLHNGDLLTDRTQRVPKNRPAAGNPPFTWSESAIDALMLKALHQVEKWSLQRTLYELERYNGFGYRRRALPTPYLWSFTNLYQKGKYVRDHEFDPEAVSKQCGAAAILKGLDAVGEGIRA